jgi:integrase
MAAAVKLTVKNVLTLGDGKHRDDDQAAPPGFYLWVRNEGRSRIYVLRYTFMGTQREISVGGVRVCALREARQKAREYRALLDKGLDPKPHAKATNEAPPKRVTVWDDCLRWFNHEKGEWSPSTQKTQMGWIKHDVLPLCGDVETATLTPKVLAAMFYREDADGTPDPTCPWIAKNETAQRAISILRRAIDHAIASDDEKRFEDKVNPVLALGSRLPKGCRPDQVSRRSVSYEQARAYYHALMEIAADDPSETQRTTAVALLTMIETFAPRTSEILNMQWAEITKHPRFGDVWIIPAGKRGRMKNKRNDRTVRDIPLLACTLARLQVLRLPDAKPTDYVFRGQALGGKRLGGHQMRKLMQRLARQFGIDATPHGWRTTAKTWGKDHDQALEVIEIAHDRVTETAAGERYNDTTLLRQRKSMAE